MFPSLYNEPTGSWETSGTSLKVATLGVILGPSGVKEVALLVGRCLTSPTTACMVQSEGGGQGWPSAGTVTGASARWRSRQCDLSKCHQVGSRCLQPLICPGPKSVLCGRFSEAQWERCGQAVPPGGAVGGRVGEGRSLRSALSPQGLGIQQLLEAVLKLLPLDTYGRAW